MANSLDPARTVTGDPNLGNARTEQLMDELQVRIESTTPTGSFARNEAGTLLRQLRNAMHNVLDHRPGPE